MSLIPSESLNFPDSFRANVGWRLADEEEQENGSPKPEIPASGWPEPSPGHPNPEHATAATVTHDSESTTASDSSESARDDGQLELLPNVAPESGALESASGTAEMTALLKHFLAATPASASASPQPPVPATGQELELSPGPEIGSNKPTNGHHDFRLNEAPNEEVVYEPVSQPNRTEIVTGPEPELIAPAPTTPSSAAPNVVESEPAEHHEAPSVPAPEHIAAEAATPITGSIAVESAAQEQHILELIAAAVQRGALAGQSVTPGEPSVSAPAEPVFEEKVTVRPEPILAPAPTIDPLIPASFDAPTPVAPLAEVKAPAKIRITPRKIKPRAVEPAAPPAPEAVTDDFPAHLTELNDPQIVAKPAVEKPWAVSQQEVAFVPEPLNPRPSREDLTGHRIAGARHQFAQTDLLLFTARERRNRWIGFGLSELAVLTALVLLGRFGFTHRFPDPTIKLLVFILIFVAAAVAVALPIAFFRNSPERWGRDQAP
jgi:hypothetical protein